MNTLSRSGTPLIYRAVPSWFVRVAPITEQLVKNNLETRWYTCWSNLCFPCLIAVYAGSHNLWGTTGLEIGWPTLEIGMYHGIGIGGRPFRCGSVRMEKKYVISSFCISWLSTRRSYVLDRWKNWSDYLASLALPIFIVTRSITLPSLRLREKVP